jgi:hypothetical protein
MFPSSKPHIYAFYKQFCESLYFLGRDIPFAAERMKKTGIPTLYAEELPVGHIWNTEMAK